MADNYLGRKMEEYFARPVVKPSHKAGSLGRLLAKNRSHRAYDPQYEVRPDQLERIIKVNTRLASARNQQVLRFRTVLGAEAKALLPELHLGGALPELGLPLKGTEPRAFIVICSTIDEDRYVDIDLGISAQTMLLQAVEIGLNGICIAAFDRCRVKALLGLEYDPLLVVAVGRGIEKIELTEISAVDNHAYYRENGTHYVPKVRFEDLILADRSMKKESDTAQKTNL